MQHLTQLKTPQDQLNVLVVTEQTTLYDKLCTSLSQTSCQVEQQPDKNIALLQASLQMWNLILIDSSAFDGSNIDLCAELRWRTLAPIVLLTDILQIDSLVQAYESGVDLVFKLPIQTEELTARITALLRRTSWTQAIRQNQVLSVGDIYLFNDTRTVRVGNQTVALSPLEYRLLRYLMQQTHRFVSKSELVHKVWRSQSEVDNNLVDVTICRLRNKLEADPTAPKYLINQYGIGYKLQYP